MARRDGRFICMRSDRGSPARSRHVGRDPPESVVLRNSRIRAGLHLRRHLKTPGILPFTACNGDRNRLPVDGISLGMHPVYDRISQPYRPGHNEQKTRAGPLSGKKRLVPRLVLRQQDRRQSFCSSWNSMVHRHRGNLHTEIGKHRRSQASIKAKILKIC